MMTKETETEVEQETPLLQVDLPVEARTVEQAPALADTEGLGIVERAALAGMPVEIIEQLRLMARDERNEESRKEFEAAFAAMQPELPAVAKAGEGHQNARYAKLEDVQAAVRPILGKHGFSVRFKVEDLDAAIKVSCILSHRNGHSDTDSIKLPYDTSGSKNVVQARGSTVAYGKRYTLCNILGIQTGGEDNDGQTELSGDTLTPEQVGTIRTLLTKLDRKEEAFLTYMGKNSVTVATELENVPIESFEKMQETLAQWAKKLGAKSNG
jgi:hypothetical protein